jgi:exopolysaccharide biosynthesis protein
VGALLAYLTLRGPLERSQFLAHVSRATGLALDVDRLQRDGDGYLIGGLRAHTRGGALVIEAARARVRQDGPKLSVTLGGARIAFDPQRYRGDEADAWHASAGADGIASVDARDATLTIVGGDVPVPRLMFERLAGTLSAGPDGQRYDVTANLQDGGQSYPIVGRAEPDPDGVTRHAWSAAALPLQPFVWLAGGGEIRPLGGWLRDLDVRAGASLHATVRLDDVALALGPHALAALHGTLEVAGDGVGSRSVAGVLDEAVPFEAAGEVHDLPGHGVWLREGSQDLRALARLTQAIAAEPRLRSVRVEATAPGLAFGQYGIGTDHGPLAVSVLSADPHEPTLHFDTALADDHVVSGGERTSAMGVRTSAVAGVNGDYFDIGRTYQPQGMLVKGGVLRRGPTDRAALSFDRANNVTFSEFRLHGSVVTPRGTMPVTEFNDWPPGYVSIITTDYGRSLRGAGNATFVALEPAGKSGRYRVTGVVPPGGAPEVSFGIAIGSRVHVPIPKVGETLSLNYGTQPATGDAIAAIGGGPILLRDGAWFEDPHAPAPDERDVRWPVVALGRERDGRLLLVAVDGRHPERSVGATRPEFGALLQRLGATDAMALDSGGSVTLVSRAPGDANVSVRNVPSDNSSERWISDGLFLYSSAPSPTIVAPGQAPTPLPEARPTP